jgi:hypothetical protein
MQQASTAQSSARPGQSIRPAQSRADLDALQMKRNELKSQLTSISERRRELFPQQMLAQGNPRRDLEARVKALDDRSARLEQELLQTDDAITDALARGVAVDRSGQGSVTIGRPGQPGVTIIPPWDAGRAMKNEMARVMVFEGLGFVLLGLILWRVLRRRGPASALRLAPEESARMAQLQRAVDVIAVEVERISEGQRYVTKLLGDKLPAIGTGPAQDIPAARREALPARKVDTAT